MRLPILQVNLDTRRLTSFALIAFIAGSAIGGVLWNLGGVYNPNNDLVIPLGKLKHFTSYDELKGYIIEYGSGYPRVYGFIGRGSNIIFEIAAGDGVLAPSSFKSFDAEYDYSGTNIQVEGVDEADVVKNDGEYIYYARGNDVIIIKAYPADEANVISRIKLDYQISDLYVSGNRLVVFSTKEYYYYDLPEDSKDNPQTILTIFDLSDRADPKKVREFGMDGVYFNSRLIGNYLYYIIVNPAYCNDDDVFLPRVRENDIICTVEAEQIWYIENLRGWLQYYTIASLNIEDIEAQLKSEILLLDSGSTIYVSPNNMYLTTQGWNTNTTITNIGIQNGDITFTANNPIPGYILNQFSMDEYNGYFRIATTSHDQKTGSSGNNVYILNEDLTIVGTLENLAPGEDIYSARFMGNRCYLVTFKKIDPLFTIDLSDPKNPKVLGKLKIPGYSDYLHPYDEETLIGVGKETVEAKEGDFSWYQGVKISLFDVSDVNNPREISKIEIGDRGPESPALYNHHAFLFSKSKNLLVIPILEAKIDEGDFAGSVPDNFYGEYIYQGAYVFDISKNGIKLRGKITHLEDDADLIKSGFWFDSVYQIERSLYIKENLYTLSQGMIKISNLNTLTELAAIDIGE